MDPEERQAVKATLKRFVAHVDATLSAGEGPDGDLAAIPRLLAEARRLNLVAEPAPEAPGYELGVWGQLCNEEGLARSLLTLSLLAEACAGFATAVHAQGLGWLALGGGSHHPPAILLAAVTMPVYGLPLGDRERSAGSGLHFTDSGSALLLSGSSHFLLAAGEPEVLVCFAQEPGAGWASLVLDARTTGVTLAEVTQRTGLRAARQYDLHCDQVTVSPEQVLQTSDAARRALEQVLACDWLGQAAIALGVARRALRDSRIYTAQRVQGGRLIEEHASIQLLQGTAEYDVGLLAAILFQHAGVPLSSLDTRILLAWAIQARLAVVEHAHRAVTHCLQTLGGYGYMEDHGFEKRLRDVSTLKSLHGAPDQLKLYLNQLARRS